MPQGFPLYVGTNDAESRPSQSVIFSNVGVGAVEHVLIVMEFVFQQGPAKGLLHVAFAGYRALPVGEAHDTYGGVNIVDDALHDNRRVRVLYALE